MGVFSSADRDGHTHVLYGADDISGLKAIVAIHSTALGPALGGTRFFPYQTDDEALHDVLRLSQGMTLKNAAAGLDHGGGKAVIIGDPRIIKTEALMRAYGRLIESLGGRYVTAEDVGTTAQDMEWVSTETRWVTGTSTAHGGSGDPSPATALGVFSSLLAAADYTFGSPDLAGRRVAVQGVGKVGHAYVGLLVEAGAEVLVADVWEPAVDRAVEEFGVKAITRRSSSLMSTLSLLVRWGRCCTQTRSPDSIASWWSARRTISSPTMTTRIALWLGALFTSLIL